MLSRTADNLYWMARYMERAENLARLLEVGNHMALLPGIDGDEHRNEWHSTVVISGAEQAFYASGRTATAADVIGYIALDPDNPSSIYSCIRTARDNGRAVRTALTSEMWENLNATWLDLEGRRVDDLRRGDVFDFLEWVKERSSLFRGSMAGTMLRNEPFFFTQIGTFIERGDNTARILDVKSHTLQPKDQTVGDSLDYYQWITILRSVAARRSYHWLYRENPRPARIAELLILRAEMPRSLAACLASITRWLDALADDHGRRHECHRLAWEMYSSLKFGRTEDILARGLHAFLNDFIVRNNGLGAEVAGAYL